MAFDPRLPSSLAKPAGDAGRALKPIIAPAKTRFGWQDAIPAEPPADPYRVGGRLVGPHGGVNEYELHQLAAASGIQPSPSGFAEGGQLQMSQDVAGMLSRAPSEVASTPSTPSERSSGLPLPQCSSVTETVRAVASFLNGEGLNAYFERGLGLIQGIQRPMLDWWPEDDCTGKYLLDNLSTDWMPSYSTTQLPKLPRMGTGTLIVRKVLDEFPEMTRTERHKDEAEIVKSAVHLEIRKRYARPWAERICRVKSCGLRVLRCLPGRFEVTNLRESALIDEPLPPGSPWVVPDDLKDLKRTVWSIYRFDLVVWCACGI